MICTCRLTAIGFFVAGLTCCEAVAFERPNVVIMMADDLGFSDLGCYGGEIETPFLDLLAAGGLRFTQFYNTGRCWPTRASLLTGFYAQQIRRDTLQDIPSGASGKRPAWSRLLPDMLKPMGYRSYHSGKWHIDGMPLECGFDRSYYLKDQGRFFNPRIHWEDDRRLPPVEPDSGFYGTTAIGEHATAYLQEHAEHYNQQPFFLYLAFTAPHFPLHALKRDIERYRERYARGWAIVRQRRWEKMCQIGLTDGARHRLSQVERNVGPPYEFPDHLAILGANEVNRPLPWNMLSESQKTFQATKMAIHAAMVHRMDCEVGRVLGQLRRMKALDNTLIFFLSDNGASAEIMVRADGHDVHADPGSAKTYLCLGPGWSTTCNTPFRRHKTWTHEGGICTPMIAHWPDGISDPGEQRSTPGHVIDILPTVLEATRTPCLTTWLGTPVPGAPGKSLLETLRHGKTVARDDLWWSHENNRAIRVGDWKLVTARGEDRWELYNLSLDRAETNDLATIHADKVNRLAAQWRRRRDEFKKLAQQDLAAKSSK